MMTFIESFVSGLTTTQVVGLIILLVGVVGTMMSPYRYLLTYLAAGMAYWLSIEAIAYVLNSGFEFTSINAYISAVGISMIGVFAWLAATEPKRARRRAAEREANYIEHTPMYEGEVPTSRG